MCFLSSQLTCKVWDAHILSHTQRHLHPLAYAIVVSADESSQLREALESRVSSVTMLSAKCRDNRNRLVPDRRGDSATATNSNKGPRGRGTDEASVSAADSEHMAEAAALLEQLKAKTRDQPFELQVWTACNLSSKRSIDAGSAHSGRLLARRQE